MCTNLESIELPKELAHVKSQIFQGCINLKTVSFRGNQEDYNINKAMAEKVYKYAWEDGHSSGYYEVVTYAIKYAELVEDCLKM